MFKLVQKVLFKTEFQQKLVLEQCLVRNFLHALVVLITLVAQYFGGIGVLDDLVVILGLGYIAISALSTLLVRHYAALSRPIAISGVLTDTFIICFIMYSGADKEAGLYGLLLFLIIANGLRFGKAFMQFANLVCIIGFASVAVFNEFWQSHVLMSIGNILWLILIPAHLTRLLNRLEDAIHKSESANTAKTLFLANMSHEIRTPLTSIIGFSKSLLHNHLDKDNTRIATSAIIRNGEHLADIVNDILDISKIETGNLEIEPREFSVFELMNEIDLLFRNKIEQKGLSFFINYKFPLPESIVSDSFRIRQVLINLCSNAIKFTDKGNVKIDISCSNNHTLLISVSDTGIGLTDSQAKDIFSNFSQADSSTTRQYGGTGLGLPISEKLVNILGGKLWVESTPDEGSKFSFTISTGIHADPKLINELPDLSNTHFLHDDFQPHVSGKILLVEDVIDNQLLISSLLRDMGASVDIANNGLIATEKAADKNYDLILMDLQMPVMGGREALTILRQQQYEGPVVFLTANVIQNEEAETKKLDCQGFLSKPIDDNKLKSVIVKYLKPKQVVNINSNKTQTEQTEDNDIIFTTLISHDNDSGNTYFNIAKSFAMQLNERIKAIEESFTQNDQVLLKEQLHNLRGLGGNMGYSIVTELVDKIEQSISENNQAQASNCIQQLYQAERRIVAAFKAKD